MTIRTAVDRHDHPVRAAGVLRILGFAPAPIAFGADTASGAVFYVVAGLGWLVIAMPLVKWMSCLTPPRLMAARDKPR
ncbi:MAG: DUF2842 domain-containing protein [Xanthobacteraceae bacterium]